MSTPRFHRTADARRRVRHLTDAEVLQGARARGIYRKMYRHEATRRGLNTQQIGDST
jgi:hypothetical protein